MTKQHKKREIHAGFIDSAHVAELRPAPSNRVFSGCSTRSSAEQSPTCRIEITTNRPPARCMVDEREEEKQEVYAGGGGVQWHPAIRAVGWIKDWIFWAFFASLLWEFVANGSKRTLSLGSIASHAGAIGEVLVCSMVPFVLVHEWFRFFARLRRNYPDWRFITVVTLVVSVVMLAIGGGCLWILRRVFSWLWPHLEAFAATITPVEFPLAPSWAGPGLLAAAAALALVSLKPFLRQHAKVWRLLGCSRALKGYGLMGILRLRQPRRDFFSQAPLIRDVPVLAIAAWMPYLIKPAWLAWVITALLVVTNVGLTLDYLLPPAWLFLGRSHADSFHSFDRLRFRWRVFGVTLLDRDGREWQNYYFAAARNMQSLGSIAALFMTKPRTPRVWSLRSRGDLWRNTVVQLARLAVVVVVDARTKSYYIYDEILWLAELGWIDKALLLGNPDGIAPALDGALAWAKQDKIDLPAGSAAALARRVVTEEQLYAATWIGSGVHIER